MNHLELGVNLEKRRKQLNLRQEDLAEMSGLTARTIYNIEEGKGNPSFNTLRKLCEILGLEMKIQIREIR